jgi:SAM-dependent methyltransferase
MTDPQRPTPDRRAQYAPSAPQEEFIVPLLRRHIENGIARYAAPAPPGARALDVGCGRQPFRGSLDGLGYSYTGLDVDQNLEGSVDVICAIDEPLPAGVLDLGTFEFVLCTEVLEHVADWDMAFRNLAALMSPRGRLLVTCPHFFYLHEEPYDFWRPTPHALRYFGTRAGLQVLSARAVGDAWDILGTLLASSTPVPASNRVRDRMARRLVLESRRTLLALLRRRLLQRMVRLQGSLYMSNITVFEKP